MGHDGGVCGQRVRAQWDHGLSDAAGHGASCRRPPAAAPMPLGAILGGAYAVAVFLPGLGFLGARPVKVAAGVLLSVTVFGGQAHLLRLTLLLFAVSCAMAGCVLGLGLLTGGIPVVNGIFYTDADARTLLLGATAAYAVLAWIFRAAARTGYGRNCWLPKSAWEMRRSS